MDKDDRDRSQRCTALIDAELRIYGVDIAVLIGTRIPDSGSLVEEGEVFTYFWRGLPYVEKRLYAMTT